MIIHYNNKTGDIKGIVSGRIHSDKEKAMKMSFSDVSEEDISSYVLPFNMNTKKYYGLFQEFAEDHEAGNIDMNDYRVLLSGGIIEGIAKRD